MPLNLRIEASFRRKYFVTQPGQRNAPGCHTKDTQKRRTFHDNLSRLREVCRPIPNNKPRERLCFSLNPKYNMKSMDGNAIPDSGTNGKFDLLLHFIDGAHRLFVTRNHSKSRLIAKPFE
jgi:hypothetical protein